MPDTFDYGKIAPTDNAVNDAISPTDKAKKEGVRVCAKCDGNIDSYIPALQQQVIREKTRQRGDADAQERAKNTIRDKITNLQAENQTIQNDIDQKNNVIEQTKDSIEDKQNEIARLESGHKSPITRFKFWFSLSIVILLAGYIFVFYGSVAYLAFYGDKVMQETDVMPVFYPQAFSLGWSENVFMGLFEILLPTIFLGLGFLIHSSSNRDVVTKSIDRIMPVLKVLGLYVITFLLDAVLAYKVTEEWADAQRPFAENPSLFPEPVTIGWCIQQTTFWLIIGFGFVAYIIWGMVFSNMLDFYDELTSNTNPIRALRRDIAALKSEIQRIQAEITPLRNKIDRNKGEISNLENRLNCSFWYNVGLIKAVFNAFAEGWIRQLTVFERDTNEAASVTRNFLETLESQSDNE